MSENPSRASIEFIHAVLQSSPDVILVVDEQGRIVFVNRRSMDLLGYEPGELSEKNIEALLPKEYLDLENLLHDVLRQPTPGSMGHSMVVSAKHKNGVGIPVLIALSPVPALTGQPRLVQVVLRDAASIFDLRQNMLLQSAAMQAAADGIVIIDIHGIIRSVNPAVTKMTGYASEELTGRHTRIFKSGLHASSFYKDLWDTVLAGRIWFGEIVNRRKDGSLYYEEQHITPVRGEDGEINYFIAIKQDATARWESEIKLQDANQKLQKNLGEIERLADLLRITNQELETKVGERTAELAQANIQLQELDTLKSAFIGVISHELRTPFTSVLMALEIFKMGGLESLEPEQKQMFEQIAAGVQTAYGMIENLLTYASFVRKQGVLHKAPLHIQRMVDNALLPAKAGAEAKGLTLTVDNQMPVDMPAIYGDEERLADAIEELADNAVKFTPEGGTVTLHCWLGENAWQVSVEDSGPGIPAEKLPGLWESFAQMTDPLRRGREGLGLGLALVEYIVRAHNGEVWAESKPGVGSTFGFRIPLVG